jgi:glycosyltransferase involved in cell wall biosynthesis
LASLYENNPKSLLEAMSCGMLVIGTKVKGIKDIIQDGINGFLCEPIPESIRETVLRVFSSINKFANVRMNARNYIERNCALKEIVKREIDIYRRLLSGKVVKT